MKAWQSIAHRVREYNARRMAQDAPRFTVREAPDFGQGDYDRMERFYWLALAGEVGEGCNLAKKRWRDGPRWTVAQRMENLRAIREELCDVRIYVEALAELYGMDLDAECEKKMREVAERPFAKAES